MTTQVERIIQALDDIYKLDDSTPICELLDVIKGELEEVDKAIELAELLSALESYGDLTNYEIIGIKNKLEEYEKVKRRRRNVQTRKTIFR